MTLEDRAKEIADYAKSHWDSPNLIYLFALENLKKVAAKRYWLFSGDQYYPSGGMNDYRGEFATLEEAEKAIDGDLHDWFHIYDSVGNRLAESD